MARKGKPPRVVVVTGASSGIGLSAARLFGAQGDRVVLAARRVEKLLALQAELSADGHEAMVVETDLADLGQAETLVSRVVERFGRVDVLVNNAGYGAQRRFEEMPAAEVERMFTVNVLAPMALARGVVPLMRRQGSGWIINVASVGGLVAHPFNVAYCASKHALVGFSKSLRLELKGTGIRVVAVCPAGTRTEFFDIARGDLPFSGMIDSFSAPAEKVARAIVKASRRNRKVVFPTQVARFLSFADRWLPWLSEAGNIRYRDQVLKLTRAGGPGDK